MGKPEFERKLKLQPPGRMTDKVVTELTDKMVVEWSDAELLSMQARLVRELARREK